MFSATDLYSLYEECPFPDIDFVALWQQNGEHQQSTVNDNKETELSPSLNERNCHHTILNSADASDHRLDELCEGDVTSTMKIDDGENLMHEEIVDLKKEAQHNKQRHQVPKENQICKR